MAALVPFEERVSAVVASVLGCDRAQVRAAAALYDLPGFDSVTLMTIVERLERDLGTEIPAEWIVPEAFASVSSLAGLLEAAARLTAATPAAATPAAATPTDGAGGRA